MSDILNQLAESVSATIESRLTSRLTAFMERFARSQVKIIYTEKEAAAFLGCGKETLAAWRKRGLISHAVYPQGKNDELSSMVSYSAIDLLNFRQRYVVNDRSDNVFQISQDVSLYGAEIKRNKAA